VPTQVDQPVRYGSLSGHTSRWENRPIWSTLQLVSLLPGHRHLAGTDVKVSGSRTVHRVSGWLHAYGAGVSIEVTQQLAETLTRYGFAYLVTIGDDARAHVVAVTTTLANGTLLVTDLGRRTHANLAADPSVTLVWPPANPSDYSLIVDGVGSLREDTLAVSPTRAVLHRPAPPQMTKTGNGCESDCVELPLPAKTASNSCTPKGSHPPDHPRQLPVEVVDNLALEPGTHAVVSVTDVAVSPQSAGPGARRG
jgi:hypothetical protein